MKISQTYKQMFHWDPVTTDTVVLKMPKAGCQSMIASYSKFTALSVVFKCQKGVAPPDPTTLQVSLAIVYVLSFDE